MAHLAPALVRLRSQLNATFPGRSKTSDGWIGDEAHANRVSDHNPDDSGEVRAFDFTADPSLPVQALADSCAADTRATYVIYDGRINYGTGWRTYTGSNPHTAHVHVSVRSGAANHDWNLPVSDFTLLYPHANGRFTSGYGMRTITVNGKKQTYFHQGDDIAPQKAGTVGAPVLAPCDMTIRRTVSGRQPGQPASNPAGGSLSPVMSGNGILGTPDFGPFDTVAMGHFKPSVKVGQKVKQGEVIGYGDLSGGITGPHIHLEVWRSQLHTTHADPTPYLIKEMEDMPLTAADYANIANAVWNTRDKIFPNSATHAQALSEIYKVRADVATVHNTVIATPAAVHNLRVKRAGRMGGETSLASFLANNDEHVIRILEQKADGGAISVEDVIAAIKEAADETFAAATEGKELGFVPISKESSR